MKICFLNHDLKESSGAGRFGLNLIGRFRALRTDMEVIVLTSAGPSGGLPEEAIIYPSKLRLFLALPRIRAIFKKCDVIHALDGWPYGVIAALASLGLGKKLVITAIGTGAIQAFRHPLRGMLLCRAYRRADALVAISNYTRRKILAQAPGLDIAVINHAIDSSEFLEQEELSEEEKLEIEKLKPYILSVGGWKKRKGFEYSFAAFAEIIKRFPEFRYVVCGIGPKPRLTEPLGITGKVSYFKGVRWPFLKAIYRNAELFMLLPQSDGGDVEGFGFAFLEAAAAGLPVIGARNSGAEDAVKGGTNGFLVEPGNSSAAAEAAVKILSDGALRRRLAAGSIEFAKQMSWQKVVVRYLDIYRRLSGDAGIFNL